MPITDLSEDLSEKEAEEAAARDTFTGKMAAREFDFTDVELLDGSVQNPSDLTYRVVRVRFTKAKSR